ncbi:flippase-like domain-containing protein [Sphingomonas sp. LB-2]|uniref:lysylphosphatidylglycerol synthase transmembrane domain-containing protein n=1 Tax=Sphingomonas caeni TaxID=2984949 RepID=UPI0022301238|nr:lysylphosphatidylglycerol synthase transmembrane domain-containing protein [Sphingomonas caeni]MCW3849260.1 flippase-like domain-containing protein [Sphingomonas caeni]
MSERRQGRWLGWAFAALALGGLFFAVLHFGDLSRFAELARRAQPLWLVAALCLQASTYVCIARGWQVILRHAQAPQPLGRLLPVAILKLFVDQLVPTAGIGGNVLLAERLTRLGAPRPAAMGAVLVSMIGYYLAYAAMALATLALLWIDHRMTPALLGLISLVLLFLLAVTSLVLWLHRHGKRALPGGALRITPLRRLFEILGETPRELLRDRPLIARVSMYNALIFVADAATLALCLAALGEPFWPVAAFAAFMVATIVATLGPIPMGLGTFEAASTATLHALGVPLEAAFAATLLLRGMSLWLPMLPGLVLARKTQP